MTIKLLNGDCREMLKALPSNSVDACVTDPPYGLSFMGKAWDYDVPGVETWREVFRVLKPGAHLLSFFGSRTYHRGVIPIEDAGFEIRDQIMWLYSTGFPKSHNLDNHRGEIFCDCEPPTEHDLQNLQRGNVPSTFDESEGRGEILQPGAPQQGAPPAERQQFSTAEIRGGQSGVERRGDFSQSEGELREREVRSLPAGIGRDGAQRRLRDGTPLSNGAMGKAPFDAGGVRPPSRSQAAEQPPIKPRIVARQSKSQNGGAWENCHRCGKPNIPRGLGTALKPAHEPIVVARKPFSGTVAKNTMRHGTGGLNIDGCRVGSEILPAQTAGQAQIGTFVRSDMTTPEREGRWPANVIHDGSDEVLNGFPHTKSGSSKSSYVQKASENRAMSGRNYERNMPDREGDEGSAARFFYCAKTSKRDRDEGLDLEPTVTTDGRTVPIDNAYLRGETLRKNNHPTVKPADLMRYLCRLVTPPGGTVLDPFMGSGSTGKAAILENFNFIGVELSPGYLAIAKARIYHSLGDGLV